MNDAKRFLAVDFGAESGRAVVVTLSEGKLQMKSVRRWPNRPVCLNGTRYWDFLYLFSEMLEAMKMCAERGVNLA